MGQLVNIRTHVPEILDLQDSNYSAWSTFFELMFQKFGIMDHVDGTVDAPARIYDVEWTQIDHCMALHHPNHGSSHHGLQAPHHRLLSGDMRVSEYCGKLKKLADTLNVVGHPISDMELIVNMLRGVNSKFRSSLGIISTTNPPPTFLYARSFLLQEEQYLELTHKMEAATALVAAGSSSTTGGKYKQASSTTSAPATFSPSKSGSDRKKKHKQSDGRNRNNTSTAAPQQPAGHSFPSWGLAYNPWTGVVQAWPMPQWCPRPLVSSALVSALLLRTP
ncbi:uncharacterized protein LOC112890298 [Panicum hallii]|uniref:uncharacterized protein LOC112890298 n=1 Tax=Panicum hallii TaxID=206008 RepID=UPI000DF4E8CE|nr:uncharacterized protein LOC112890298 [Panicum hallii]